MLYVSVSSYFERKISRDCQLKTTDLSCQPFDRERTRKGRRLVEGCGGRKLQKLNWMVSMKLDKNHAAVLTGFKT